MYTKKARSNIRIFSEGDIVSIAIPKINRTATNLRCLPCQVFKKSNLSAKEPMYRLATENDMLRNRYRSGDLMPFNGTLTIKTDKEISLREAARLHLPHNIFLKKRSGCTSICLNGRCLCRKQGIQCSTHCHPTHSCKNTAGPPVSKQLLFRYLMKEHISDVGNSKWLTDLHIRAVSEMLKSQQSSFGGLFDPVLP